MLGKKGGIEEDVERLADQKEAGLTSSHGSSHIYVGC